MCVSDFKTEYIMAESQYHGAQMNFDQSRPYAAKVTGSNPVDPSSFGDLLFDRKGNYRPIIQFMAKQQHTHIQATDVDSAPNQRLIPRELYI